MKRIIPGCSDEGHCRGFEEELPANCTLLPNAAQQLAFPLPSQALAQRHLEHFSGWCSGARLCGNGAPPRSSRAKLATVLHIIARNALARYQKFNLPLNFSDRDGSKVGVTQSLIELRKSCLLESGPLCDACLYLLA